MYGVGEKGLQVQKIVYHICQMIFICIYHIRIHTHSQLSHSL